MYVDARDVSWDEFYYYHIHQEVNKQTECSDGDKCCL